MFSAKLLPVKFLRNSSTLFMLWSLIIAELFLLRPQRKLGMNMPAMHILIIRILNHFLKFLCHFFIPFPTKKSHKSPHHTFSSSIVPMFIPRQFCLFLPLLLLLLLPGSSSAVDLDPSNLFPDSLFRDYLWDIEGQVICNQRDSNNNLKWEFAKANVQLWIHSVILSQGRGLQK